jgi:hypothetical protein
VEGVCLTHAHDDHFTGLEAIARQASNPLWIWSGGVPLDSVVDYYDALAQSEAADMPTRRFIAKSVRGIASWAGDVPQSREHHCRPCRPICDRDSFKIFAIAPSDGILTTYNRELMDCVASNLSSREWCDPPDLHNKPSCGLVVDMGDAARALLLGDMVKASWEPVFERDDAMALLSRRKASVIKRPHHCSRGAMFEKLLDLVCDPEKTVGVFTPFCLTGPPPHPEAIKLALKYLAELWTTVPLRSLPRYVGRLDDAIADKARNDLAREQTAMFGPATDCRVSIDVHSGGDVRVIPGRLAARLSV